MELIERKIGETFEFEGKKIEVKAASSDECDGCFFNTKCTLESRKLSGECDRDWRNDGKSVLFVEKQPQEKIEEIKERKVGEIFEYEGKKIKHRIKPESQYRPFETQEECWEEMHKHPDFGWVTDGYYKSTISVKSDSIVVTISSLEYDFGKAYIHFTFADGTPFGIKEE